MAQYGKTALELYKEFALCPPEVFPPYNDELVRVVQMEVQEHKALLDAAFMAAEEKVQKSEQAGTSAQVLGDARKIDRFPEDVSTIVVHHSSILRNKRLLLAYSQMRLDKIKALRWQGRSLPDDIKNNLSTAELQYFKSYDRLLSRYMRHGEGVGQDLTLDLIPPKDPEIQVRALEDYGEMVASNGTIHFQKNAVFFMAQEDAEPLIRQHVLERMDMADLH
ncbi:hypothetical protein ABBQ32_003512 [Trebouxia sp. C0010 RCD-2024]